MGKEKEKLSLLILDITYLKRWFMKEIFAG
jgi:hypothetical protein